jgi:hypothetical protein
MKSNRKITFGILITLTVLCCFGAHAYSIPGVPFFAIELSTGSNHGEGSFSSDIDSFEDDQNYHVIETSSVVEPVSQIPVPRNYFLINKFFLSFWQPPKIS